jgi:prefoldin subunit 5
MRPEWPDDTVFHRLVLDVESEHCERCGRLLHICDHRFHRIHTLQGPLELVCRLAHCSDGACPARCQTLSPAAELSLTLPWWLVGWDVFCWMGQRRFVRHWSVPQIQAELQETYHINLCRDTLVNYLRRYQNLVAARQQDPQQLAQAYRRLQSLVLTIDGLQPEKGHETLYVVRELNAKRVWFGEALLSSSSDEVRRLLVRAGEWAKRLGLPVRLWLSDKQDAFVKGIAAEFAGVPHRYCQNHFLRDLAKPTLEKDSHAKVQMRKQVRGLRAIEREVLEERRQDRAQDEAKQEVTPAPVEATASGPAGVGIGEGATPSEATPQDVPPPRGGGVQETPAENNAAAGVVLDYCAAVRGILNDDQGGPLHPPGLRMAEALTEVQESLQRNLALSKPGPAHGQLERLAGCIESGLACVQQEQEEVRQQVEEIAKVAATLEEDAGTRKERRREYHKLQQEYQAKGGAFYGHLGRLMLSWLAGLFLGPRARKGEKGLQDNLELERWFRKPKRHERQIHGRRHAGVRIVQEGPTLILVLDAHDAHPGPFTAEELLPYWPAEEPLEQQEALQRRKIMRQARSKKNEKSSSES